MYWLTYLLHFNRNSNLQVSRLQSLLIQDPVLSRNWGWIVRQGSWSLHLLAGLGNFLVEIWKYLYLANWNIYFRGEICKGSLVSLGIKCCEFEGQSPWPYKLKKRNFKSCIRGPLESLLTRCHGVPETTGFCFWCLLRTLSCQVPSSENLCLAGFCYRNIQLGAEVVERWTLGSS